MKTASVDIASIINEAYQLGELIIQSEIATNYLATRKAMEQDLEAQALIHRFIQKKSDFEEIERFGKYHPDYKAINKEMREFKREMDMHEKVASFKKAERELESILNEVSQLVAFAVSEQIKVPNGNPFWDSLGCGGSGCGSGGCGSCGN